MAEAAAESSSTDRLGEPLASHAALADDDKPRIAQMLANDRAVLGLGQAVVVGMTRPGLGELGRQFVEHLGHLVIDVLRTVLGKEADDDQWDARQQRLDDR